MTWLRTILAVVAGQSTVAIRDTAILLVSGTLFLAALLNSPIASVSAAAGAAGVAWWFRERNEGKG